MPPEEAEHVTIKVKTRRNTLDNLAYMQHALGYANLAQMVEVLLQTMYVLVMEMEEKDGKPAILYPDGSITAIDITKVGQEKEK